MAIKKIFKSILPLSWLTPIKKAIGFVSYPRYIFHDLKHLIWPNTKDHLKNSLLAKIKQNYHRLEKGMTKSNQTIGRGSRAAHELIVSLKRYKLLGLNILNIQFQTGLSVLKKYFNTHGRKLPDLNKEFNSSLSDFIEENLELESGVVIHTKEALISTADIDFKSLSKARHSIRNFSPVDVPKQIIFDAIDIAKSAPSVCNRQGWKVWLIKKASVIETFKKVHNGFSDNSQNLKSLLVITFKKSAFSYPLERHQGYTDSGLFAMSLMHALTSKGIASCPLNANLTISGEKRFRKDAGIANEYGIVMFIAVGNYLRNNLCAVSNRDNVDDIVNLVDD